MEEYALPVHLDANWWGSWNPWVFGNPQREENTDDSPATHYGHRGSDQLSPESVSVLGTQNMPNCNHDWRKSCQLPSEVVRLYRNTPGDYSAEALVQFPNKGDQLVSELGLHPALCSLQEAVLRQMDPQLEYVNQQCDISPDQYIGLNKH